MKKILFSSRVTISKGIESLVHPEYIPHLQVVFLNVRKYSVLLNIPSQTSIGSE